MKLKIIFAALLLLMVTLTACGKPPAPATSDMLTVSYPQPNDVVHSPFDVTGKARGTWYFEATFPVYLEDANGKKIAITYAQAQGEWMTTEFVPFSLRISFNEPDTETGTLVLERSNPSNLPENAAELRIPVRF